ncbi:MAG: Holliday junction branch migration protein RuvA [Clostridia bacterium]|jgi:Holliday junction DNA helicase RuvA|nr:Holliday junction branch migration protein RuvA [Clostridia bacterium]
MISFVRGIIEETNIDYVVLDVSGIGYKIFVPSNTVYSLPPIGMEIKFNTYMNVKEDSMNLYGFINKRDMEIFEKLISVSGIGPKSAMSILSATDVDSLVYGIINEDITSLSKLPGIGKKTAQRVILELKDKFAKANIECVKDLSMINEADNNVNEAICALTSLGYMKAEVTKAIATIDNVSELDAEEIIKVTLKNLARI